MHRDDARVAIRQAETIVGRLPAGLRDEMASVVSSLKIVHDMAHVDSELAIRHATYAANMLKLALDEGPTDPRLLGLAACGRVVGAVAASVVFEKPINEAKFAADLTLVAFAVEVAGAAC